MTYLPLLGLSTENIFYLCLLFVLLCLQAYSTCLLPPITSGVIEVPKQVPKMSIYPLKEHEIMGRRTHDDRVIHMTLNTAYRVFGLTYISRIWCVRHFILYYTYLLIYYVYFYEYKSNYFFASMSSSSFHDRLWCITTSS